MISPGTMRTTATIQQPGTRGTLGQPSWDDFLALRGELKSVTGQELHAPEINGSEVSHVFTTRYHSGVKANMRLVVGSRIFTIKYPRVLDEGNPRFLEIYLRETLTV